MKKLVCNLVLTLAFGAVAFSQGGQGRGMMLMYDHPGAQFMLASRADVQLELKVSDDSKAAIMKATQDRRAAMRAARADNSDQGARDKAMMQANDDYNKVVGPALSTLQNKRLMEIFIQMADGRALEDPDVQKSLAFTDAQKETVSKLVAGNRFANEQVATKLSGGQMDQAQAVAARHKNDIDLNAALLVVLTAEQKPNFAAMTGEKFTPDPTIDAGRRGGGN